MNEQIRQILSQIIELEDDLLKLIQEQQAEFNYRIEGTKVLFEKNIRKAQRRLKTGIFSFIRQSQPRNVVTAPFIYSIIVPLVILDIWIHLVSGDMFPLIPCAKS